MEFKSAPSALMKFSSATHTAHGNSLDTNWRTCVHSGIPFGWLWLSKGTLLDLGGLLKNEEDSMTHLVRVLIPECPSERFSWFAIDFRCLCQPPQENKLGANGAQRNSLIATWNSRAHQVLS